MRGNLDTVDRAVEDPEPEMRRGMVLVQYDSGARHSDWVDRIGEHIPELARAGVDDNGAVVFGPSLAVSFPGAQAAAELDNARRTL